jgi:protocatechuate 3,4-dioxygenase beta subunit
VAEPQYLRAAFLRRLLMHLDDLPVGRVLTRREALAVLGSSGALLLLGSGAGASAPPPIGSRHPCVVRPVSTPGPYWVDEKLNRADIRSDPGDSVVKEGVLLTLTMNLSSIVRGSCSPLRGAIVDLWQCDAEGVYSDAEDPRYFNTVGQKFLRGYQVSDKDGVVKFTTIYPGWYPERTPHIHYKIRSPASARSAYEFVGQMYFDDELSDRVYARAPYAGRGKRMVSNPGDRLYNRDGGRQSMLSVTPAKDGYAATFDVAVNLG